MYNLYDFEYFLRKKEVMRFTTCSNCKISHRCKLDVRERKPCDDGYYHSFFYTKLRVPFIERTEQEDDTAKRMNGLLLRIYEMGFTLVYVSSEPITEAVFVNMYETYADCFNFINGLDVAYISLYTLRDLYIDFFQKDKLSKEILESIENCHMLFLDNVDSEELLKTKAFSEYIKRFIDIRKKSKNITVIRITNGHLKVLDFLKIWNEGVYLR